MVNRSIMNRDDDMINRSMKIEINRMNESGVSEYDSYDRY